MMLASGYLGAIAAKGPVSLTVPSMITTAPAGIVPDSPRRGSVMAYAPRMMIVSVIISHPCNSRARGRHPGRGFDGTFTWPRLVSRLHQPASHDGYRVGLSLDIRTSATTHSGWVR